MGKNDYIGIPLATPTPPPPPPPPVPKPGLLGTVVTFICAWFFFFIEIENF